jgi:serine/arginine repetitive matrix protein 2
MYNGVGLTTPRGSGSSGYVQKNLAYIRRPKTLREFKKELEEIKANPPKPPKKPNAELIEHEQKRQVEIRLMKFREELKAKGETETEIEAKVGTARAALYLKLKEAPLLKTQSSHQRTMEKEKELSKVKSAFNVRDDYLPGSSFDFEAIEEKRLVDKETKIRLRHEYELKCYETALLKEQTDALLAQQSSPPQQAPLPVKSPVSEPCEEVREAPVVIPVVVPVDVPVVAPVVAPVMAPVVAPVVQEVRPVQPSTHKSQASASSSRSPRRQPSRSNRRRYDNPPQSRRYRSRSRSSGRHRRRSSSSDSYYRVRPSNRYEKRPAYNKASNYSDSSYSDSD